MSEKICRTLTLPALLLALVGCSAVGPTHQLPDVSPGSGWMSQAGGEIDAKALARWWATLGDPTLEKIVDQALARNLDLRQALAGIEGARALLARAEALSTPALLAGGSVQRRRLSTNSPEYNPQRSPSQTVSDVGIDASWEIDLFGSLQRQRESASASLQASEAEAAGLRLGIAAETARSYFALRGAQQELATRRASVAALQRIHELVRVRQAAGDLPRSELERAQSRLDQAQAQLPGIEARQQAALTALGLLTGSLPEAHAALASPTENRLTLKPVPVGERADILRRRPDIIAAERRLAAATAETGVATAELFPKLVLSAGAGFRALESHNLLASDSRRGFLGSLISWRIFDGGRVKAEIHAAEARQQAAALAYEKAVLAALADAEKALSQYEHALQSIEWQEAATESTRRVLETAEKRYALGDTTLIEVLDARREYTDQQALLVQFRSSAAADLASLFKALGGGFHGAGHPEG